MNSTPGCIDGDDAGSPDVAILLPQLSVGGAELSMLRVARGLARRGLAVQVVAFRPACGGPALLPGEGLARAVELGARSTLRALPRLVRYLRRARPRVVVCGQPHVNIVTLAACRLAGTGSRTVLVEHAPPRSEIRFQGGWRYRALHALVPIAYPAADRLVAVSRGVREQLATLAPGTDPVVIHNPVLPEDLASLAAEPADHPWLAVGDGGPPVVIGVGRLAPEKDFPALVRALALLRHRRPARLLLLGEGPDRGRIEAAVAREGVSDLVALPGAAPNVFAHLSRASVFASASLFEGFGNVLVEALACGLPVVSTDCPVGPREILEGGRFGRLVPPGDTAALATALEAALADGRQPDGALEHAAGYSVQASVDRYLALIRGLAPSLASSGSQTLPSADQLMRRTVDALEFSISK